MASYFKDFYFILAKLNNDCRFHLGEMIINIIPRWEKDLSKFSLIKQLSS